MKVLLVALFISLTTPIKGQSFEIRGVLPWHNFLSGPSSWNKNDYKKYLDDCKSNGINLIAFHNYTGGGERYANYVEPMIKIQYKGVLPQASFDNSGTIRWGYLPMKIDNFAFGTSQLFKSNKGPCFGADCSVNAKTNAEQYEKAQELMQDVLKMAHQRNISMAMGFEFGVEPPEYASINTNHDMYWLGAGSLVYNPFDPDAMGLLHATIDNILSTYKGIDYIWLWLNEHSLFGVNVDDALQSKGMKEWYDQNKANYEGNEVTPALKFFGTWSQAYIQKAYDYIKRKSPNTKVVIGGWGGKDQLTFLLKGLNKTLPKDIIFSLLNPLQGIEVQPPVLAQIAHERKVWAIPWLEGDKSLWHLQPRVAITSKSVKKAAADHLNGVVAIHWRTEEIKPNFDCFFHLCKHPDDTATVSQFYEAYCLKNYGERSVKKLAPLCAMIDSTGIFASLQSQMYYAYNPSWGRLDKGQFEVCKKMISDINYCITGESIDKHIANLKWLRANYQFILLLDQVGRDLSSAWQLREDVLLGKPDRDLVQRYKAACKELEAAPIKKMFEVFASKVRSRGELGELSSLNQRVWGEYQLLRNFCDKSP